MRLKVFTLRFDSTKDGFDDSALQAFLCEREALHVFEHFFTFDGIPTWAVLVTYRDPPAPGAPRKARGRTDAGSELGDADRALYNGLRRWRNARAEQDGRPPFILFNNRQLAEIARRRPSSLAQLQEVHGVGEGKARDYGEQVLALVATTPPAAKPEDDVGAG